MLDARTDPTMRFREATGANLKVISETLAHATVGFALATYATWSKGCGATPPSWLGSYRWRSPNPGLPARPQSHFDVHVRDDPILSLSFHPYQNPRRPNSEKIPQSIPPSQGLD